MTLGRKRAYSDDMIGILLIAAGAILIWAVHASVSGVNLHTIGVILFVVGIVELLVELVLWSTWRRRFDRDSAKFFDGF